MPVTLEATELRDGRWAVRPAGQLGTMGWHPIPWTVIYVNAPNAVIAVRKAERIIARGRDPLADVKDYIKRKPDAFDPV